MTALAPNASEGIDLILQLAALGLFLGFLVAVFHLTQP